MLRRTFLKWLSASPLAFLLAKAETLPLLIADKTEPPQQWQPVEGFEFDALRDGDVVTIMPYRSLKCLFVACQWSIWEIRTDDFGVKTIRLITRIDRT